MARSKDKPAQVRDRATPGDEAELEPQEDTALLSLTAEDRDQLVMDSWEPSLLRKLLSAHNRLKRRS